MRNSIASALLVLVLLAVGFGQQKVTPTSTQHKKTASATPAAAAEARMENAQLPSEDTVNSFLKHIWGFNPNFSWKVLEIRPSKAAGIAEVLVAVKDGDQQGTTRFFVTPDGGYAIQGDIVPFGPDPFAASKAEIAAKADGPSRGPAAATATVVEFGDLECPGCKAAQSTIERLLADEPDAKLIFQNFPLEMHPWAFLGATYADCVGRQNADAFWKFLASVYANQEQITAMLPTTSASGQDALKQAEPQIVQRLKELVTDSGADPQQVAQCAAEPATADRVHKSIQLGQKLGVTGTPTLFIGGRPVHNLNALPYDMLKGMVDQSKTLK